MIKPSDWKSFQQQQQLSLNTSLLCPLPTLFPAHLSCLHLSCLQGGLVRAAGAAVPCLQVLLLL